MIYNISKELFVAVMKVKVDYNYVEEQDSSDGIFFNEKNKEISHNDFFFKCKQWALKQGYVVYSSSKSASVFKDLRQVYMSSNDSSEQQAVFDAASWIVENKDKQ